MSDIKQALANGNVWIKFTKADGTVRIGTFTTSSKYIPADKQPKPADASKPARKVSADSTRVFDVEKQEWRSFKNDSVIEWSVL